MNSGEQFGSKSTTPSEEEKHVVIIGAGWGGLSCAHRLSKEPNVRVTVIDAASRPGGLVGDGYMTPGGRRAEAGIHGFWNEYYNIFALLEELGIDALTDYAEQGQWSPNGLEAVWPVYKHQPQLPTGLGQAAFTKFLNFSPLDMASAAPLVAAFSEFDDSDEAWKRFDRISFRDLCLKLGVSRKMYSEAFEPMILTGLFAPGDQCSAAAALGMAYFFVLSRQVAFDVRWCRGNVGELIFQPWCRELEARGVTFVPNSKAVDFTLDADDSIRAIECVRQEPVSDDDDGNGSGKSGRREASFSIDSVDATVFAVGFGALKSFSRCPSLGPRFESFQRFANLRGTDVLATRLWLDADVAPRFTANPCWGFDGGRVGMTVFDIKSLHAPVHDSESGAVLEVDWYHAGSLLALDDAAVVARAKQHLDAIIGPDCARASVVDAAVVRLPQAVNWYFPGSYESMPDVDPNNNNNAIKRPSNRHRSGPGVQPLRFPAAPANAFFAGDATKTRHGSWSQEKAFVTGLEAANAVLGLEGGEGVIPLPKDEPHVAAGRSAARAVRQVFGKRSPSLADFLW